MLSARAWNMLGNIYIERNRRRQREGQQSAADVYCMILACVVQLDLVSFSSLFLRPKYFSEPLGPCTARRVLLGSRIKYFYVPGDHHITFESFVPNATRQVLRLEQSPTVISTALNESTHHTSLYELS
jgi:hypothetical protein